MLHLSGNKFSPLILGYSNYQAVKQELNGIELPRLLSLLEHELVVKFLSIPEQQQISTRIEKMLTSPKTLIYRGGYSSEELQFNWHLENLETFKVNGHMYRILPDSVWDTKRERNRIRGAVEQFAQNHNGLAPLKSELIEEVGYSITRHEQKVYGRDFMTFIQGPGVRSTWDLNFKVKGEPLKFMDLSERMRYYLKRGFNTETLVRGIFIGWAKENEFSFSEKKQTNVGPGKLEIVCGRNRKIGIDVTNTQTKEVVEQKWQDRSYYQYLDELWIVVVRDDFDAKQYRIWNRESPDNVIVIDYRQLGPFLNGLYKNSTPFTIPPEKRRKLEALANCTIYNRDEIKEKFRLGKPLKPDHKLSDYFDTAI